MQRRAAAVSVVVFLLVGTAAYGLIATADSPEVEVEDGERLAEDETVTVDSQTYTVTEISEDGATFETTVEDARYTETWANGSEVEYGGETWVVVVESAAEPTTVSLEESIDRASILENDSAADNETVTRDGEEFVVVQGADDEATLVPAEEYFPDPEQRSFEAGETIDRAGNETAIESVTADGATLAWTAPRSQTVTASDHGNVTLGVDNGQTYFADIHAGESVGLTQDFEAIDRQRDEIDAFTTHRNGLWGVALLSAVTAVLLIGVAFLPSRY